MCQHGYNSGCLVCKAKSKITGSIWDQTEQAYIIKITHADQFDVHCLFFGSANVEMELSSVLRRDLNMFDEFNGSTSRREEYKQINSEQLLAVANGYQPEFILKHEAVRVALVEQALGGVRIKELN